RRRARPPATRRPRRRRPGPLQRLAPPIPPSFWQYLRSVTDVHALALRVLLVGGILAFPYPFWAIATRGGGVEAHANGAEHVLEVSGAIFLATVVVFAGWAVLLMLGLVFGPRAWPGASREGALTAVGVGMASVLIGGWAWFAAVLGLGCSHGRG